MMMDIDHDDHDQANNLVNPLVNQPGNSADSAPPIPAQALGDVEAMERVLAQELLHMPSETRERINEEIHGVVSLAVDEHQTPDFVPQKLAQLEQILWQRYGRNKNGALLKARSLNSRYIYDYNFRLAFLRAELFDVKKTATRLNNYLELVFELYGPQALMRPTMLADFSNDELALLKEGAFQILPGRDRVGRRIQGAFDIFGENYTQAMRTKVSLYVICVAAEDEVTQQRGTVSMLYQMNTSSNIFAQQQECMAVQRILYSVPVRFSVIHLCFPPMPVYRAVKAMAFAVAGPKLRTRLRCHIGSPTECHYQLQTFGISPEILPINTNTGKVKIQNHLKWVNMRQAKEQELLQTPDLINSKDIMIECPNFQDVLLGRGKPILQHGGNTSMREIVASKIDDYMDPWTTKAQKQELIWSTVVQIEQAGGRFLKQDADYGWWSVVDKNAARQKVSIYFRDLQSRALEMAKQQQTHTQQQKQQQLQAPNDIATSSLVQNHGQHQILLDSSTYQFCRDQHSSNSCTQKQCL